MKYFVFLALFPCILAAEIQDTVCVDGTHCSQGKYCCDLPSGEHGCCDISKERQDKGYVPAFSPSSLYKNVSSNENDPMNGPCSGTQCGLYCIPNIYRGVCCSNSRFACPSYSRCCSNSYSQQPWCCGGRNRCSSVPGLCLSSAVTTSTAMMSFLLAAIIGMFSKHYL